MVKEKKGVNPAEAFRKEQKKKDGKKAHQQRQAVREVRSLLNDPTKIDDEIRKYQRMSNENKLDKSLKDKIEELQNMKTIAVRKQQIDVIQGKRAASPPRSANSSEPAKLSSSFSSSSGVPMSVHPYQQFQPPFQGYSPALPAMYQQHPLHPNPVVFPNQPPGPPMVYQPGRGIPPPPPPRLGGIPAPLLWNNQTSSSSSSGPYRQPIVGGQNGIPLPPPRLLSNGPSATPFSTGIHPASQARKDRRKRDREEEAVDPLDPAARGYVERFGKKAAFVDHEALPPEPRKENLVTDSQTTLSDDLVTSSDSLVDPSPQHVISPSSAQPVSTSTSPSPPLVPEVSAAPDFSTFANFIINKEELLKRRNRTDCKDDVCEIPPGPSRIISSKLNGVTVEDVEVDDEDDDEEASYANDHVNTEENEDNMVGPSIPRDFANYQNYYYDPVLENEELSAEENVEEEEAKVSAGGLLGLDYYSSDDDQAEEAEGESFGGDHNETGESPGSAPPPAESTEILPTAYMHNGEPLFASLPTARVSQNLKVVRADSALTSFVPNALRKKKSTSNTSTVPSKPASQRLESNTVLQPTVTQTLPALSAVSDNNDLFSEFMTEIEGLGE
jgi:hypothetical protein